MAPSRNCWISSWRGCFTFKVLKSATCPALAGSMVCISVIHLICWNSGQIHFDGCLLRLLNRLHGLRPGPEQGFALWLLFQIPLALELPRLILFQFAQELRQARTVERHPFEVVLALMFAPFLQNEIPLVLRASVDLEEGIGDTLDPLTIDVGVGNPHIVGFIAHRNG